MRVQNEVRLRRCTLKVNHHRHHVKSCNVMSCHSNLRTTRGSFPCFPGLLLKSKIIPKKKTEIRIYVSGRLLFFGLGGREFAALVL